MFVSLNLNTKTFKIASFIHLKHVYFHQLKNKIPRDVLFSLDPLNPKNRQKINPITLSISHKICSLPGPEVPATVWFKAIFIVPKVSAGRGLKQAKHSARMDLQRQINALVEDLKHVTPWLMTSVWEGKRLTLSSLFTSTKKIKKYSNQQANLKCQVVYVGYGWNQRIQTT